MKYLVAGATGFVGKHLVNRLLENGNSVVALVRDVEKANNLFNEKITLVQWSDIYQDFSIEDKKIDVVINLMGENIAAKNWSNERKKDIYNSRVDGTKNLISQLEKNNVDVKKYIQSSAIGIYAESSDSIDEDSQVTNDFLGKLCQDWEERLKSHTDNYVIFRIGMVLGKDGGAMKKILPVFKFGLGGNLGDGKQMMSWIHVHDLVSMIIKAAETESMKGVYNAVTHYPVTNKEFTETLSNLLRKPAFFNAPKLGLKLVLGEMSSVVLSDLKVKSKRIKDTKFVYMYPTIENALKEVVSK